MSKFKKTIRRKYTDFFTADDLFETKCPPINLSINEFNAKGHLVNPKAPCVATAIDPKYTEYANLQQNFRKFNVKSDILKLRDITRKKFLFYVTQQRALEKDREQQYQLMIYQETKNFMDTAAEQLNAIEKESFSTMITENEKLKELQSVNLSDELKECVLMHQKLSMEVKDVHKRFLFLLKLIGYFNIHEDTINIIKLGGSTDADDLVFLKSDLIPGDVTTDHINQLTEFLTNVVQPYLNKKTHLNADLWIAGYENTRRKFFDYYKEFTKLAILNHIVCIVHEKFMKSYNSRVSKPVVHRTPSYLKERKIQLQKEANEVLMQFEKNQLKSKLYWRIKGIAPVMLTKIQEKKTEETKTDTSKTTTISQLEQIHIILMDLLNEFDTLDPDYCRLVEKDVRRQVASEKKASRKELIKENRFQNWIEHYKRH